MDQEWFEKPVLVIASDARVFLADATTQKHVGDVFTCGLLIDDYRAGRVTGDTMRKLRTAVDTIAEAYWTHGYRVDDYRRHPWHMGMFGLAPIARPWNDRDGGKSS